ncbi:lysine-2,3-aminomutase-like protein [Chelatococcus sp. SYSU_G07232]|uniref:Lysine-2,3-aminomutase-like protein n=1 Tax=Chelatococcus albus TaxID=3047466 RepID=A0ABT7AHR7_9HYPH|nr:lysine-2,3-aminomutase-like protein [Chelatococcus sp. SYSU_G07232]MDJ1158926.1 lysine-2,3-aminomutase-like protein [Chelatococcus sp. SYSU_G07232]
MTSAAKTLRSPADLHAAGLVPGEALARLEAVAARYAVAITPTVADLIEAADPDDPIALQFVPDATELETTPEERADPIGDHAHSPVEGIVHRYPDRVLVKLVHVCPVYCRFCFRREMVGPGQPHALSGEALARALAYVAEHPEIWEVVVTGGDPLVVSPRRLEELMRGLAVIGHVRIVRFHTRVPVVAPERVTPALIETLRIGGKATYVVVHANHAREFSAAARAAIARLADAGIPLLGQSVLLRGVNDDVATLGALMRSFVENRIKPYHLNHGDLAPGTARFRTTIAEGQALMRGLRGDFSGLCQPTYVLDIPGGHGKSPIGPGYVVEARGTGTGGPSHYVTDYRGAVHAYPPPGDHLDQDTGAAVSS